MLFLNIDNFEKNKIIVVDPKGELYLNEDELRQRGYEVKMLNLADIQPSKILI